MTLTPSDILGPDGRLSERLTGYESREQQIQMADSVGQALQDERHLIVEAGTGTGKSFAYLVPAIDFVAREAGKALISTYTITLQEQLIFKDLPLLDTCLSQGFIAKLAKGRGNYLCKRRLAFAMSRGHRILGGFAFDCEARRLWHHSSATIQILLRGVRSI